LGKYEVRIVECKYDNNTIMEEEYQLGEHITNPEESLTLIELGLPIKTADFLRMKDKNMWNGLKYIDDDVTLKEDLASKEYSPESMYIPSWSSGRLLELFVLGLSTDYFITYDRLLNIKADVYREITEALKAGNGNFTAKNINYKMPKLPEA
jgi:hypothetical protein